MQVRRYIFGQKEMEFSVSSDSLGQHWVGSFSCSWYCLWQLTTMQLLITTQFKVFSARLSCDENVGLSVEKLVRDFGSKFHVFSCLNSRREILANPLCLGPTLLEMYQNCWKVWIVSHLILPLVNSSDQFLICYCQVMGWHETKPAYRCGLWFSGVVRYLCTARWQRRAMRPRIMSKTL